MSQVWGYSSGPPLSKCETVLPAHSRNEPQSGASPYSISVSNSSYTTGESLTVTIQGSGSKKFKGFILQARGSDSSVAWPVGEFTEIPADGAWCWVDFENGCREKCTRQSWKELWVVLSSLFFKEIWKNWHERPWKCVCECYMKATKVGSTAKVVRNSVLIISHITFRDCRVHIFFRQPFSK